MLRVRNSILRQAEFVRDFVQARVLATNGVKGNDGAAFNTDNNVAAESPFLHVGFNQFIGRIFTGQTTNISHTREFNVPLLEFNLCSLARVRRGVLVVWNRILP